MQQRPANGLVNKRKLERRALHPFEDASPLVEKAEAKSWFSYQATASSRSEIAVGSRWRR